jgi:peptidoglycan-associated lipoprotein
MLISSRLLKLAALLVALFALTACQTQTKTGSTDMIEEMSAESATDGDFYIEAPLDEEWAKEQADAQRKAEEERLAREAAEAAQREQERLDEEARAREEARIAEEQRLKQEAADRAAREAADRAAREAADRAAREAANAEAGVVNDVVPVGKPTASVYFDFDKSFILPKFDDVILSHVKYLRANPDLKVEIQGNCDERGSREYNLGLGNQRALAVKAALELLGIASDRISITSFGSEKPVALGHDESSWKQNRRADFVY